MEAHSVENDRDVDRRRARRVRTLKGARIVVAGGYAVYDCVIRNLSQTGALIALPTVLGVPSHFEIQMDATKQRRQCTVRWRSQNAIGVSLDDAQASAG